MIKITIAIPAYNAAKTIEQTIASCQMQKYPLKEILVWDDGSSDNTAELCEDCLDVTVIRGEQNMGIGKVLARLMRAAKGKYIVYLCSDDKFDNPWVLGDIVRQFDLGDPAIGVIGRIYYEFMDGKAGPVGVFRDRNILTSSVNPSGMAFRCDPNIKGTNAVFVEMPYIVKQYIEKWRWTMLDYDSVAVRIHPGGNTGTKSSYYTGSAVENWYNMIGLKVKYYPQFVQLKCHAPHMLWREIKSMVKINPECKREAGFWFYAIIAVILPAFIIRKLSYINRNWLQRRSVEIIERP